jgi:hypothetical protein
MAEVLLAQASDGYRVAFAFAELTRHSRPAESSSQRCDEKPLDTRKGRLTMVARC